MRFETSSTHQTTEFYPFSVIELEGISAVRIEFKQLFAGQLVNCFPAHWKSGCQFSTKNRDKYGKVKVKPTKIEFFYRKKLFWCKNCKSDMYCLAEDIRETFKEEVMLVLTRGLKQKIEIGDRLVTVTVLEVKGGRVRLGIEAPESISIRRHEIVQAGVATAEATVG